MLQCAPHNYKNGEHIAYYFLPSNPQYINTLIINENIIHFTQSHIKTGNIFT